ncbi:hypothetical protein, partial [Clostridioides difficile]|uniref:hypothetical protein n=1 Tax=Clostridioides difficile TaxID=1496 RepID=UPI002108FFDD
DTNIQLALSSKGAAGVVSYVNGSAQFVASGPSSAANYILATGATTGNGPGITAAGTDANIGIGLSSKGTGNIFLNTGGGTQVLVANTPSANRYL